MAYETLKLASDVSKRLAANRAAGELNWKGRPTVRAATGLRLDTGHGATAASTPRAAATTPAASAHATTPAWLQVDLALKAERKRTEDVFASAASRGRERSAVIMLTGEPKTSAADIIARLSGLATDAHFAGVRSDASAATRQATANATWDRAYDRAFGKAAPASPVNAKTAAVWDAAISNIAGPARA